MSKRPWPTSLPYLLASLVLAASALASPLRGAALEEEKEHLERMATEHAGETPEASPAAEESPRAEVEGSSVVYGEQGGKELRGYLARPAGGKAAPGVLVIHEWWGLNENIQAMAERLAGEGYAALAVDLYGVEAATDRDGARTLAMGVAQNPEPAEENLRLAHAYLSDTLGAPKVGSVGWCFGGGWSLRAALLMPEDLDAAVIYYGRVTSDETRLAALETPILGLFGSEDRGIPVEGVKAFEAALQKLGKEASIHVYEGANHAFANPSGQRYDPKAASDAWAKTLEFFDEHLTP